MTHSAVGSLHLYPLAQVGITFLAVITLQAHSLLIYFETQNVCPDTGTNISFKHMLPLKLKTNSLACTSVIN